MNTNISAATRSFICITLLLALAFGTATAEANNLFWNNTTGTWDVGLSANWTGGASLFANGDTVNFTNAAGGTVTIASGGVLPGSTTVSNNAGTYTLTGAAIGGSGTLTMNGGGTLNLTGANTYTGGSTISAGTLGIGVVSTASGTTITGGATGTGNVTLADGVTLGGSSSLWNVPTLTLQGDITLAGTTRQQVNFKMVDLGGGTRTIYLNANGGNIKQAITGNTALEGTGRSRWENLSTLGTMMVQNGSLVLATTNTGTAYSGFMFYQAASFAGNVGVTVGPNVFLQTGNIANGLGSTTTNAPQMTINGIWSLQGSGGANQTVYSLSGSGTVFASMNAANTTARTLTLNGTAGSTDFSGSLNNGPGTGALSLTKTGASTQILSGTNTYTGSTTVSGGTLTLASSGSLQFVIGASGVNNGIYGTGAANVNGTFNFDLTGASTNAGDNWIIVNVGTLLATFGGTFNVAGFVNNGGGLWAITNNGIEYQFRTSSGLLSVPGGAPPPPISCFGAPLMGRGTSGSPRIGRVVPPCLLTATKSTSLTRRAARSRLAPGECCPEPWLSATAREPTS